MKLIFITDLRVVKEFFLLKRHFLMFLPIAFEMLKH